MARFWRKTHLERLMMYVAKFIGEFAAFLHDPLTWGETLVCLIVPRRFLVLSCFAFLFVHSAVIHHVRLNLQLNSDIKEEVVRFFPLWTTLFLILYAAKRAFSSRLPSMRT
jgi:hypothetical protein